MKKHYANRPFCNDVSTVKGKMNVMCKWYFKPLLWLSGTAPPYNSNNIDVTVNFKSSTENDGFTLERIFRYKNKQKPFYFRSRMHHIAKNEVIEIMRYGFCWHIHYGYDGEKVILSHKGYSLRILGYNIRLPITYVIGASNAFEKAIDDNSFYMSATVTHWLFGVIYQYQGNFKVKK